MNDQIQETQAARNRSRKTLISIVIAVLIVFVMLGLTLIGAGVFWVHGHINAQLTSEEAATEELNRERARFADQLPLIEWRGESGRPIVHRRSAATATELQALRVLAFDSHAGKLVRVSIPFWILRLAPSRNVRLFSQGNGVNFDSDRLHLTVEDLEKAGPGLVLDARDRFEGAVLVWVE
jgi:hypothetical protein